MTWFEITIICLLVFIAVMLFGLLANFGDLIEVLKTGVKISGKVEMPEEEDEADWWKGIN